jgi:type IV pilus assembly protein PilM
LNLPVEYFNPLRNLQIDPELAREELAKVAHSLGEIVGLGLRNLAHCPVELNLMPPSSLKRQEFNQKKPYLVAAVFCLILIVFAYTWFYDRVAQEKASALDQLKPKVQRLQGDDQKLRDAMNSMRAAQQQATQFTAATEDRLYWGKTLTELRNALIAVEDKKEKELSAKAGVWIEKLIPLAPPGFLTVAGESQAAPVMADAPAPRPNPRPRPPNLPPRSTPPPAAAAAAAGPVNEISTLLLTCRSVNLNKLKADAHTIIAEGFAEELRSRTNFFNAEGTKVTGEINVGAETNLTFVFNVTVKLARPVRL